MKGEIKALVKAGNVTPAALGQSLGMAGLNIGKVVADINAKTKQYAGMKMPIKIVYDLKSKDYEIIVSLPPTSQLIMKEAGVQKGAGDREAMAGDISFDKLLGVYEQKREVFGSDKKKSMLQIIGACVSIGLTIDGKDPKVVQQEVRDGQYDDKLA